MVKKAYALIKEIEPYSDEGVVQTILGVYVNEDDFMTRLERIERANPQYPLEILSPTLWRVGPQDGEGFFGDRPVYLRKVEVKVYE